MLELHKIIRWFLLLAIILALAYLGYGFAYGPIPANKPVNVVVVTGKFPYSMGYSLELKASYYTTNPLCKKTGRTLFLFPTTEIDRKTEVLLDVVRGPGDAFVARVALDYIRPGLCEWRYGGMWYGFNGRNLPRGHYVALGGVPLTFNYIELKCRMAAVGRTNREYVSCWDDKNLRSPDVANNRAVINFVWEGE